MTLIEHVRCMRLHVEPPKIFWTDVINTAVFMINRGSSVPLDDGIQE